MAAPLSPVLNLNGYTDLPAGKIANIVTYLEMRSRPRLRRLAKPPGWSFVRLNSDRGRYRAIFRRVGEPWLWFSRTVMSDAALAGILADERVEAFALNDGANDIGLLELDFRGRGDCELMYFGVVPEAIGQGAGRLMMNEAIRRAFLRPIGRFFLHTCSLDHPGALAFYTRSGFMPYKQAVEVADDPRLKRHLPLEAGPQVPIFRGLQSRPALRPRVRGRKPSR